MACWTTLALGLTRLLSQTVGIEMGVFQMRIVAVLALLALTSAVLLAQSGAASAGIGLRQLETCRLRPTPEAALAHAFGRVAVYEVTADQMGTPIRVERVAESSPLLRLVQIDAFESCVRRWRFGQPGVYSVTLTGGTTGVYQIDIAKGADALKVMIPEFIPR